LSRILTVVIISLLCLTLLVAKEQSSLFMEDILLAYNVPLGAISEMTSNATAVSVFRVGVSTCDGVVYAIAVSQIVADQEERLLLPGAAFNTALSFSLEKYAREVLAIEQPLPTLRGFMLSYLRDSVLGALIKKFLINERGLYKERAFAIVAYRETDLIEKPIIWLDHVPDFELSLYKSGYDALLKNEAEDASNYFWGVYQLNYRYADDALAFLALIELNEGNRETAERYLRGIGVLNLTVNGLRVCARIYSALERYDYASYFYRELLKANTNDAEAKSYFQKREETRIRLLEDALGNIHLGNQDN